MNIKMAPVLAIIAALIIGVSAAAIIIDQFTYNQNINITGSTLVIYVDGTKVENDSLIEHGDYSAGSTSTYNLTVCNNGTTTILVYLKSSGLPSGWADVWTSNDTLILPYKSAIGNYTLTIPANATIGTYTWITKVIAEKPP